MTEIIEDKHVSQRDLSRKLELGLGTINVLINKMIKEGLIKMEQVTQKQVSYMLTPVGMMEKAKKTVSYIKSHYSAIHETKEKIKYIFEELNIKYENILVLKADGEMGNLIKTAVAEYKSENKSVNIKMVDKDFKFESIKQQKMKNVVLVHAIENQEDIKDLLKIEDVKVVNLLVRL